MHNDAREADVAKKVTKKRTAKRSGPTKTARRKTVAKKTAARKTARRSATTRTAKKKTAARAAATRKRRAKPAPPAPSRLASATTAVRGRVAGAIAAVTDRLPWGSDNPDALQILEREHRRFEDLLKQGEETTDRAKKTRHELLATLGAELNAHELMEEKVLYPALQAHPEARDIVLEGFAEHHVADLLMGELREVATDDEQWGAKFKVLKENIEHHIQEEEGEMFRTARGVFSREEMQELAAKMLGLKRRG
jgi:hemerythrin-like domain-containing protein